MPKKASDPNAATREILTAIVKGTRKLTAQMFSWNLAQELRKYRRNRHEEFLDWLRVAGIKNAPTPDQCAAAAKVARSGLGSKFFPHPRPVRDSY